MNGFRLHVHSGCTVYAVRSWWKWMGSVPTSLGEWIHSPWFDLGLVVWKGYRPRVRLVLAGGHASAWFSPFWRGPAPGAQRYQAILGFSAGSYTGLAIHEILNEFRAFPGTTKVAAVAAPPAMLNLATGERTVTLIHCTKDRLCVWKPDSLAEVSYGVVLIEGTPTWAGRAKHAYGHLLFADIEDGTYQIEQLQVTHPEVLPHVLYEVKGCCEYCHGSVSIFLPTARARWAHCWRQLDKGVLNCTLFRLRGEMCEMTPLILKLPYKLLSSPWSQSRGKPALAEDMSSSASW